MRSFLLLTFMFFSLFSSAQSNQLVYKKLLPNLNFGVKGFPDHSGYLMPYTHLYSGSNSVDIGIWTENLVELISNDTAYMQRIAYYDNNFNIINSLPIKLINNGGNGFIGTMQFAQSSNLKTVMYFSNSRDDFGTVSVISGVYTPLSNFVFSTEPAQCIFLVFDPVSNSINELLRYTESYAEPFPGYFRASFVQQILRRNIGQVFSVLNNNTLVAYLNLYENQSVISPNETIDFTSWGGQENSIRVALDINSGEVTTQQIGSNTGNLSVLAMQTSNDLSNLYRIGLVRGNDTPISISGNELDMSPSDSLYHVFITKEDVNGYTQWLTELYAYNNTAPDTILSSEHLVHGFFAQNQFSGIIEKDNELFVSSIVKTETNENDTLLYRDFLGQDSFYRYYVPNHFIDISDGFWPAGFDQISFSEKALYKLSANGTVIKKLSHTNKLSGYGYPIRIGLHSGANMKSNLFEIDDKLAWINHYHAVNDSLGQFVYQAADGGESTTSIDLPAGTGVYILWLDTDLNIIDHWIFPFQPISELPYELPMTINSIIPYSQDTLLIQGSIHPGATTNLDPFGSTPDFTSQEPTTFFAFYSNAGPVGTSNLDGENQNSIKSFPNPTQDVLNISGIGTKTATYVICDIAGRTVEKGKLVSSQINTQSLNPGMYILYIESEKGSGTQKFVVR